MKILFFKFLFLCLTFGIKGNALVFIPPELYWWHPHILRDPEKRTTDYPFITCDTLRSYCDFVFDETNIPFETDNVKTGDTIYVIKSHLIYFFENVHPHIHVKYILVTHFGDATMPGIFKEYLKNDNLAYFISSNIENPDQCPKLIPVPVGLAPKNLHYSDFSHLENLLNNPTNEKKFLLYLNHWDGTNPKEREPLRKLFKDSNYCYNTIRKPFSEYIEDLAASYFVISPPGAGLDCFRNWEAMLLNCIPIVLTSPLDYLFEDLPILIIEDWSQISEEFLILKKEEFAKKTFKREKLLADYWLNLISNCKSEVKNRS